MCDVLKGERADEGNYAKNGVKMRRRKLRLALSSNALLYASISRQFLRLAKMLSATSLSKIFWKLTSEILVEDVVVLVFYLDISLCVKCKIADPVE